MLGLIKTRDTIDLCCKSDPAIGGESDEWEVKNGHTGATVVTIRPLNDREMLRLSGPFGEMAEASEDAVTAGQTLAFAEAMAGVVRAAFVACAEGDDTTEDPAVVLEAMRIGPLIGLGSYILSASGSNVDPT